MDPLQSLINDKTSGSVELTIKLNQILKEEIDIEKIEQILVEVENNLTGFASVDNYIINIRKFLTSDNILELKEFLNDFEQQVIKLNNKIFENAKSYLSNFNSFLTLSNSYTILQVLIRLNEIQKIKVVVCESRPKLEGKILAQKLSDENINVKVITDAEMSVFIPKVDALILGADKIFDNGNIINKTGSFSAALISKYYNKPVYVIADKTKYVKKDKHENNAEEKKNIWNTDINNSLSTNIDFEEVPVKLITKIITD